MSLKSKLKLDKRDTATCECGTEFEVFMDGPRDLSWCEQCQDYPVWDAHEYFIDKVSCQADMEYDSRREE